MTTGFESENVVGTAGKLKMIRGHWPERAGSYCLIPLPTLSAWLLLLSLTLGAGLHAQVQPVRKTLLIGLDGLRPDALKKAHTPNLDTLMAHGTYSHEAWCLGTTLSGPAWCSIMTGVWEQKHHVTNDGFGGANFDNYPYFTKRLKEEDPGIKCVQLITWNPLDEAANGTGGKIFNAGWDESTDVGDFGQGLITDAALIRLQDDDLDVLYLSYTDMDAVGHSLGFNPNVPEYIAAIEDIDVQIGEVLQALKARPNYAGERWMIAGTSDHGGIGTSHGGNSDFERTIWWMVSGDMMPRQEIFAEDPGSYQMPGNPVDPVKLEVTPVQTDIAVTILDWMLPGVDPESRTDWDLDGKSWLPESSAVDHPPARASVRIYPNPANRELIVMIPHPGTVNILNISGGEVFSQRETGRLRFEIELGELPAGLYCLTWAGRHNESASELFMIMPK